MAREASATTLYIRKLISKNEDLTYSQAKSMLEKAGYEVSQETYNVVKSVWLRKQRKKEPEEAQTEQPQLVEALKFVSDNGGLAKVKADLAEREEALNKDKVLLGIFEDVATQIKAAS